LQRLFTWFFTLTIVAVSVLWIVVSYLPDTQAMLPTFSLTGMGPLLAWLGVAALIAFVAIQFLLVNSTDTTVREYQTRQHRSSFRLSRSAEFFWTALPIVMTAGLAWASYALWLNLMNH
jgi:hypothetical protein